MARVLLQKRSVRRAAPLLMLLAFAGCREDRARGGGDPPTYDVQVRAILASRCKDCHGGEKPAGNWRASSYLEAIACVADGRPATAPPDESAPILRVLEDARHAPLLQPDERAALTAWVHAGSPKFRGTFHEASFVDPRSDGSHGRLLRAKQWRPMLDAKDPEACGRCHEGVPRPEKAAASALGATACTSCHTEKQGVLACSTCHGDRGKGFPPRDPCFFPEDLARGTAHAAHAGDSKSRAGGLACSTCHPAPPEGVIGAAHGNGSVEIVFDPKIAGSSTWDAQSRTCTTSCHARPGGAKPRPAWTDRGPLGCNDCHGSPPPAHSAGACSGCHREANATGTALSSPRLHVDGRVEIGDGSGKCGACHGNGDDPWPSTNAHGAHRAPGAAASVPCATCHTVPTAFGAGSGHPRGGAPTVVFSGRAGANGAPASFANGTCKDVYCHGGNLVGTIPATPAWNDTSGKASKCGACHGIPPGQPHIASTGCELCHGPGVETTPTGPRIVPSKAELHVDGKLDRGP